MNEILELQKLKVDNLIPVEKFPLDDLQREVLKNIYLEIGYGDTLFLFSPRYTILSPSSNEKISEFVSTKETLLSWLKLYLLKNLIHYTVILENNSYFIEQNDYLMIARLRERNSNGKKYEVKYYTHSPKEIISHYEDKIYIGRDFIDLFHFKRKYYGIDEFVHSIKDQYEILVKRGNEKLKNQKEYKSTYMREIKELVGELYSHTKKTLPTIPPYINLHELSSNDLIEIITQYRSIKHFLIELEEEISDFENQLRWAEEINFARYVTKYKRDVTNLISYLNFKIICKLSSYINKLS
ncbi:MAG: hypothetical protein AB1410_10795 [Acidobacteriota bacterium]